MTGEIGRNSVLFYSVNPDIHQKSTVTEIYTCHLRIRPVPTVYVFTL